MREKIKIQMRDGICEAYRIQPSTPGHYPAVLVLMDAFGIRDSLLDYVEQIANAGFSVTVPNLYYRSASLPLYDYPEKLSQEKIKEIFPQLNKHREHLTPENIISDGKMFLNDLGHDVRLIGFCMGVGIALRIAASNPSKIKAVSGLHGGKLVTDDKDSPHLVLKDIQAKLFLGFADHDGSMNQEMIDKFESAMKETGKEYISKIYKSASHGYTQKDLPAYQAKAHDLSLKETIEFFS